MRWKLWLSIILLACCQATFISARPQSGRRGLSMIVVPTEKSAAELRARIDSGASFEALALANSTDPTATSAGYTGMVDEGTLMQEFRDALLGLKPGAVSAVARFGESFLLLKWTTPAEDGWRSQNDSAASALQRGQYGEAASLYLDAVRQAEKLGPADVRLAESLNGLAQTYRYQQNYAAAEPLSRQSLAILEQAVGPSNPGILPSLTNLAGIARAAERYAEAEQFYRRILSVRWGTPDSTGVPADRVLEKLAQVLNLAYARDPGFEKAAEEYWKSISESRVNKELFLGMRDQFMAARLMAEAESLMQRAVRQLPDSRQLQFQLAEVYVQWGKYEKAIEALQEAARPAGRSDPSAERGQRGLIYATIAQMNFFLVRFDEAFVALTKALEINPDSTSSRLLLGALYLRRNKLDDAAAEYRRVVAATPLDADAHEGLAQVALTLGRYADAVREADKALQIKAELQSSRYIKAMALIRDGRDQEGRTVLEEYQQREADRKLAESRSLEIQEIDIASSAMITEGRPREAIALLREGTRTHPLTASLYRKLGLIQSQLGLHAEAVETLEATARLRRDDFLVHLQLAREFEALGNPESARQQRVLYLQKYDAALQAKAN